MTPLKPLQPVLPQFYEPMPPNLPPMGGDMLNLPGIMASFQPDNTAAQYAELEEGERILNEIRRRNALHTKGVVGIDGREGIDPNSPVGQLLSTMRASPPQGMSQGAYAGLPAEAQGMVNHWSSGFGERPNAFQQLIEEKGAAIGSNGMMMPRGLNVPGVRSLPLGIGGLPPEQMGNTPEDLAAGELKAVANLMNNRGYVNVDQPSGGFPAIRTENNGWIQMTGDVEPSPEVLAKRDAYDKAAKYNAAVKGKAAQDKLTQRGQQQALARHQRMGTATLPELMNVMSGSGADPSMMAGAMFGPEGYSAAVQGQTAQAQMNNQREMFNNPMLQYFKYLENLPDGAVPMTPQEFGQSFGNIGGGAQQSPGLFGQMPDRTITAQLDAMNFQSIDDAVSKLPATALVDSSPVWNWLTSKFGVQAMQDYRTKRAMQGTRGRTQSNNNDAIIMQG